MFEVIVNNKQSILVNAAYAEIDKEIDGVLFKNVKGEVVSFHRLSKIEGFMRSSITE